MKVGLGHHRVDRSQNEEDQKSIKTGYAEWRSAVGDRPRGHTQTLRALLRDWNAFSCCRCRHVHISLLSHGTLRHRSSLFWRFIKLQEYLFQRRFLGSHADYLVLAERLNQQVHAAADVKM